MTWMQVLKLPQQEAWASDLAARLKERDHEAKVLAVRLMAQEGQLGEIKVLTATIAAQEAQLKAILSSASWRITSPLRKLGYLFPRIGKTVRAIIRLLSGHSHLKIIYVNGIKVCRRCIDQIIPLLEV